MEVWKKSRLKKKIKSSIFWLKISQNTIFFLIKLTFLRKLNGLFQYLSKKAFYKYPLSQLRYLYLISFTPQKKFTEFIKINKFTQENSIEKKRKKFTVTDLGNYNHVN